MNTINKYLQGYLWTDLKTFFMSLFPSTKYDLTILVISLSSVVGMAEYLFGLKAISIVAFCVCAVSELITGIVASVVKKIPLQSHRFSRFGIKLVFILVSLFITYTFKKQFIDSFIGELFTWLWTALFAYYAGEYIISINENIASISGKSNKEFIDVIKRKLKSIIGISIIILFFGFGLSGCSVATSAITSKPSMACKDSLQIATPPLFIDSNKLPCDSVFLSLKVKQTDTNSVNLSEQQLECLTEQLNDVIVLTYEFLSDNNTYKIQYWKLTVKRFVTIASRIYQLLKIIKNVK